MSLRPDQYISIAAISVVLVVVGVIRPVGAADTSRTFLLIEKSEFVLPVIDPTVVQPQVSAAAAIVIDEQSAVTLYEKNATVQFPPASTTKLLTALVARSMYELDAVLTVPTLVTALDGTRMGLVPGEKLPVSALLQGALIQSGNDAALTLAAAHPAGVGGFVSEMNSKADFLHLTQSNFTNPIGYDAPGQLVTPRDLALLAREVMKDPVLRKIVGTAKVQVSDTKGAITHDLVTTHKLLGVDPTVIGIKTGTTEEAGEVLITQFKRDAQSILIVIMGSDDRYKDTQELIEYVRTAVHWETVFSVPEAR